MEAAICFLYSVSYKNKISIKVFFLIVKKIQKVELMGNGIHFKIH